MTHEHQCMKDEHDEHSVCWCACGASAFNSMDEAEWDFRPKAVTVLQGTIATPPRELTPGEMASLEKIAELRGQLGQLRRACRAAHRILLKHEHVSANPGYPLEALTILSEALGE